MVVVGPLVLEGVVAGVARVGAGVDGYIVVRVRGDGAGGVERGGTGCIALTVEGVPVVGDRLVR